MEELESHGEGAIDRVVRDDLSVEGTQDQTLNNRRDKAMQISDM